MEVIRLMTDLHLQDSLWLALGSKAHAMQNGRGYVTPEDVQAVVYEVLRHRVILTYEAQAENIT